MDEQLGRPVLIEFWDFCRPNSIRTLPYLKAWHARYADAGLRVIGVHTSGFPCSEDPEEVRAAVARLQIAHPVVVDVEREIWADYGNLGWPARYLFDQRGMLFELHYGEGAYEQTERAIQELLGIDGPTVLPLRPEDAPEALLEPQSADVAGAYSGPYRAGGVWAVLDGSGQIGARFGRLRRGGRPVEADSRRLEVTHPGAYELISHPHSTTGELKLQVGEGVRCHAVCFTPGLA
jgi:thiol-disulfide isomerase/thioredoxin